MRTTEFVPVQLLKLALAPPKSPETTVNPELGVITYLILVTVEQVYPLVADPDTVFPVDPVFVRVILEFGQTISLERVKFASGLSLIVIAGELAHELSQALVATT